MIEEPTPERRRAWVRSAAWQLLAALDDRYRPHNHPLTPAEEIQQINQVDARRTDLHRALDASESAGDPPPVEIIAAKAWWIGRQSVRDLPFDTATGPKLQVRCTTDVERLLRDVVVGQHESDNTDYSRDVQWLGQPREPLPAVDYTTLEQTYQQHVKGQFAPHAGSKDGVLYVRRDDMQDNSNRQVDGTPQPMTIAEIAQVCHEANRAYCLTQNDDSQVSWEDTTQRIRTSAIQGVQFAQANPESTPKDQHEAWLKARFAEGFVYGEKKDPDATPPTHPCCVEYEQLPIAQRRKDALFRAVVRALTDC